MRAGQPEPAPHAVLHGGDLDAARARFPGAPEPWIDLSTGINPEPYPLPDLAPEVWTRLPLSSEERRLRHAAAYRYGAASSETVVSAPGTQAIIQILPRIVPRARVAVLGPTYGEHVAAWRQAGHDVVEASDFDAARAANVVVVVNPDNPTGRIVPADMLYEIAMRLDAAGGLLVVDEAFADVAPAHASIVPDLPPSTVVLRSLGKMYGLAGVRLGFAIAQDTLAQRVRDALGPWAVSGPALAIGAEALADDGWLRAALASLDRAARRLDDGLAASGCTVLGGTLLFRLARHSEAARVADSLGHDGILVRQFSYAPECLRFGLPGSEAAWERLERALGALRGAERAVSSS
ncbi:MAG TPA: threonine-phosphate decarboxylase CobD [Hyphomicrobium sp.]|nr:threonine-phosphate decarboxylase CobD [Hyphomicrobium sp.]HRO49472.1 threonine-phosphate decarboxylase CobD [Hyphomicrobium sp.]